MSVDLSLISFVYMCHMQMTERERRCRGMSRHLAAGECAEKSVWRGSYPAHLGGLPVPATAPSSASRTPRAAQTGRKKTPFKMYLLKSCNHTSFIDSLLPTMAVGSVVSVRCARNTTGGEAQHHEVDHTVGK